MPPTYDANTVPAISVSELTHAFKGHQALNQVSFAVMPQTLHGFVGPNGAGKTTTLKVICTLLKPNWGQVQVFGHSVRSEPIAVREKIGFMPDHFSMYRQMTVFEYLDFFAAAYGLNMTQRDQVINDVLTLTDMDGRRNDLISGLSRGMQQRVSLARVLVHDPDLLLLDEPASGLDPRARIELMDSAAGHLHTRLFTDYVHGEDTNTGSYLPRITPLRYGVALHYTRDRLSAAAEASFHADQDKTASNELPTDSYTLISAELSYAFSQPDIFVFLRGTNLTDEEARQHTSPLKDTVPLPGRSLQLGLRYDF